VLKKIRETNATILCKGREGSEQVPLGPEMKHEKKKKKRKWEERKTEEGTLSEYVTSCLIQGPFILQVVSSSDSVVVALFVWWFCDSASELKS
jgi:hypothetical protein